MTEGYARPLLDEARRPHGEGMLAEPTRTAHVANPMCGDAVDLDIAHDGARVLRVAHRTRGCAFTRASASILARLVPGVGLEEARQLCATLRRDIATTQPLPPDLDPLSAVRVYPARIRCALLPWDALGAALDEA